MVFRKALLALAFAFVPSLAIADTGTPEQQAACRPDVRKFCSKLALGFPRQGVPGLPRNEPRQDFGEVPACAGGPTAMKFVFRSTTNDWQKCKELRTNRPVAGYCRFSFDCLLGPFRLPEGRTGDRQGNEQCFSAKP